MIGSNVNLAALHDRLSEFLEVERLLADQYGRLDRLALSEALRSALRAFRSETEEHVKLLSRAMIDLGGEPAARSLAARATIDRLRSLEEVHLRGLAATGEMLESLLLIEAKSQLDWQLLQQIGQATDLTNLLDVCAIVRPVKDERTRWLGQQVRRITAQHLTSPSLVPSAAIAGHDEPPLYPSA